GAGSATGKQCYRWAQKRTPQGARLVIRPQRWPGVLGYSAARTPAPFIEAPVGESDGSIFKAAVLLALVAVHPLVAGLGRRIGLIPGQQGIVQELNAAFGGQHHPRLHLLGGGVALDKKKCDLRVLVVVVRVL